MAGFSTYMVVFRMVHILAGVVWVGGIFLVVAFLQPSAASIGPAAGPFVQEILGRRRLPVFLLTAGAVTIGAGLLVYWRDWQLTGSLGDWIGSRYGAVLTIGAVVAIVAWFIGLLALKPTIERVLSLAGALAKGETPPPPERMAELQRLQARTRQLARLILTLLVFAVLAMASAEYW